ncbi:MAG: hypothetical protein WCG45_05825 [bacterium]
MREKIYKCSYCGVYQAEIPYQNLAKIKKQQIECQYLKEKYKKEPLKEIEKYEKTMKVMEEKLDAKITVKFNTLFFEEII